jgi:rhodanese-related sulfurtransferase
LIDNWMLLALALGSGFALMLPVLTKGSGLDPQTMVQLMNREKAVVIDVCEPDEFARGHVIGSKNLPLGQLEEKLGQVVKNKSAQVIMVCQVGARSARAAAAARKLGLRPACRPKKPDFTLATKELLCKPSRCTPPLFALIAFGPSSCSSPKGSSKLKKSASTPIRSSATT